MKPEKIKDANKKLSTDPNYNARTLYVPEDFKQGLTPVNIYCYCSLCYMHYALICIIFIYIFQAVRQWWELKSQNFDCILFFKVGKFYEMYHMDAVTAAKELNLLYMKVIPNKFPLFIIS